MTKSVIVSPNAAPPVGPYSPAVRCGDLVFFSGQIALDGEGNLSGYSAADQARVALANLGDLLREAGLTPDAVVKTTIFLIDFSDFAVVNEAYAGFFEEPYPARSTVQVAELPKGVKVEIEAIAVAGGGGTP